jgi:NADPH:quinone reductase-like Zn-dependent oxidoreductase
VRVVLDDQRLVVEHLPAPDACKLQTCRETGIAAASPMKAALCTHYGPAEELVVQDVPSPTPGKGQVVVTVKACGVNFPDVLMIQDKYQFKPKLPFSPGGEIAGIVKEAGEGVTAFKPGDKVIVSIGSGGFAEEAVADAARCVPMPDNLDFAVASSFFVTYGTSYHALKDRAHLKAGRERWWCWARRAASGFPPSSSARRWARA